jgi:hypothetical protein
MGTDALNTPGIASSISVAVDATGKSLVVKLVFNETKPKYNFVGYTMLTADGGGILLTFSAASTTVTAGTTQSYTIALAGGTVGTYVEIALGNGRPNPRLIVKTAIPN